MIIGFQNLNQISEIFNGLNILKFQKKLIKIKIKRKKINNLEIGKLILTW